MPLLEIDRPTQKVIPDPIIACKVPQEVQNAFDQLNNTGAIKYVSSVRELVENVQILSDNDNANLIGQKGLKYVNSLQDHSSPIIKTINNFL